MPNWAEQVTAIATAVSSLALLSAIGAVIFAARQARETRIGRQAETAVEFFRRWNESALEETRRLVAQFETPECAPGRDGPIHRGELGTSLRALPRTRLFRAAGCTWRSTAVSTSSSSSRYWASASSTVGRCGNRRSTPSGAGVPTRCSINWWPRYGLWGNSIVLKMAIRPPYQPSSRSRGSVDPEVVGDLVDDHPIDHCRHLVAAVAVLTDGLAVDGDLVGVQQPRAIAR